MMTHRAELLPDSRVRTMDGIELGRIKHVEEAAFAVDVRDEPDYWLRITDVLGVDGDGVRMNFDSSDVQAHAIRYGDLGMER